MDSIGIYQRATSLVRQVGTRDAEVIAKEIGIKICEEPLFNRLLGMYTVRWKHRMIVLNPRMDWYLRQMVIAHELGHDSEHRDIAKASKDGLKEFALFHMNDPTEYEANAYGSHVLLDNDDVYRLARMGYDVAQISQQMGSNINLMLIKMQEMNKLGYDFNIPYSPDSRFFRKIQAEGSEVEGAV